MRDVAIGLIAINVATGAFHATVEIVISCGMFGSWDHNISMIVTAAVCSKFCNFDGYSIIKEQVCFYHISYLILNYQKLESM